MKEVKCRSIQVDNQINFVMVPMVDQTDHIKIIHPPPYGSQRQTNRSDASRLNMQKTARNFNDRINNFGPRDIQNNRGNAGYILTNETDQAVNNQGNETGTSRAGGPQPDIIDTAR